MPIDAGRRCRLLLAIPELDQGGPDRVVFDLARLLDRQAFEIHVVVVSPTGYYLSQLPPDVTVHQLGTRHVRTFDRYPGIRLRRLIRSVRPDVVMVTLRMIPTAELTGPLPHDHALVARVPNHLTALREDRSASTRLRTEVFSTLMLRGVRRADVVIAQSSPMLADLTALGVDLARVRTTPNPIDGSWVDERTAEGPVASLSGTPRLLGVGRLEMQKGFDVLVRALPTILARHPHVHATVLGEGSQRDALEALARQLDVSGAVTFAGASPNPFPAYAAADLLVAPSRWEGLSNTMLEALAAGLPVVATDGAAAGQDLVTSGRLGRLAHPEDPDGFAAAVLDALDADFDRDQIASEARQTFASSRIVATYADVFLDAAAARPAATGGTTGR